MLQQLYISNFTLIEKLDIDFYPGFSVITGETGAGKSIILGAISLLLGNRADSRLVKTGTDKCVVEARFDISHYDMRQFFVDNDIDYDPSECIMRRELRANGKSRAFINDTPVALAVARELGERLVDIHSQHQNLLLQKYDFQLNVTDIMAANAMLLQKHRDAFMAYSNTMADIHRLEEQIAHDKANEDFLRFQVNELQEARLDPDEQQQLEQEAETLSHAEDIKTALFEADRTLTDDNNGVVNNCRQALSQLSAISDVCRQAKELAERLDGTYIELKDISHEISAMTSDIEFDPQRMAAVSERLDTIYSLQKKHHTDSVAGLIALRDSMTEQLSHIDNGDEELECLREKAHQQYAECMKTAQALTSSRSKAARKIEKEMTKRLLNLGMPNTRFELLVESKNLAADGADRVAFLFSANKNMPLQPVSQVASGGEIARVMLALKAMISGAVKLPTIIFDEIDTGVSGRTAEMMADIMKEMGDNNRQVISITHLPQIAALGTNHYKVEKNDNAEGTTTTMRRLSPEERITEIAQMLSGSNVSEAAKENAKTLLGK